MKFKMLHVIRNAASWWIMNALDFITLFKCFDPKSFAVQIQSKMDPVLYKRCKNYSTNIKFDVENNISNCKKADVSHSFKL